MAAIGVEGEVTRTGAGSDRRRRRVVGRESALLRVEAIDEDLVQAEVGGEGETVRRVEVDRVTVRSLLPGRVGALALVLHEGGRLVELAVLADGQAGDT